MNGRISHLLLNVNRYNEAKRFYGWLLPRLGYPNQTAYADDAPKRGGRYNDAQSVWVQEAKPRFRADQFHRHRVGLCEIALSAESRRQKDELAAEIERQRRQGNRPAARIRLRARLLRRVLHRPGWPQAGSSATAMNDASERPAPQVRRSLQVQRNVREKVEAAAGSLGHQPAPCIEIAKNRHDRRGCSFV